MLEPHPTRRDPRLLVLLIEENRTRYVALDAWEVAALGVLPTERRAFAAALWRLFTRARPTHVLLHQRPSKRHPGRRGLPQQLSLRRGLPLACIDREEWCALEARAPAFDALLDAYPELRHLLRHDHDPLVRVVRVALAALLTRSLPPRRYVPGLPPRTPPPVDS